jgi:addiction module HigA family antidote
MLTITKNGVSAMAMKNPIHPGRIVREDCLTELGLSVTEAAAHLGVGRAALSALVNERASVSIEMAYRLSKAFGSTPDHWMRMQLAYDLAQSRSLQTEIVVGRIAAA